MKRILMSQLSGNIDTELVGQGVIFLNVELCRFFPTASS